MTSHDWMFSFADIAAKLPETPDTMRFHYALRHGTMKIGLYGPRGIDTQTPHRQDELYIIVSGSGYFRKNDERRAFAPHDAIFVEAGAVHRFEDFTEDFLTWVTLLGSRGWRKRKCAELISRPGQAAY